MKDRTSWFIKIFDDSDPDRFGIGEVAPLPGLSTELNPEFESDLEKFVNGFQLPALTDNLQEIYSQFPLLHKKSSILFAIETAILDLYNGGNRVVFKDSPFLQGKTIPINGLIWMGGMDFMLQQIEIKIRDGSRCIKLKVGGLDFEKECDVLQYVRRKYFRDNITIRLDANGAFKPEDALYKLTELTRFNIHSIEQPLKKGSEYLPELCAKSPIPIALDEELLGVYDNAGRVSLLEKIKPQYVILKPSLHGGFQGSVDWIAEATKRNIGWWLTSSLESSVGLNALAQFVSRYHVEIPQGLGTGSIYDDNFFSPLEMNRNGELGLNSRDSWQIEL